MTANITNNKVLIFGGSGYIGGKLVHGFLAKGFTVVTISRAPIELKHQNLRALSMNFCDFNFAEFSDFETIIYCAGIAHNKYKDEDLRYANVELPKSIAEQCVNKVKKFIFISTVNVLDTRAGHTLNAQSHANPIGKNACSKYDAECALKTIFEHSSSYLTILRCPMIYGNKAPGNFALLVKLAVYPLPFKQNQTIRSMLHVQNLVDLVYRLVSFEGKPPLIFMPTDSSPLRFNELLQSLSIKQGKKSTLFHINRKIVGIILKTAGRDNINQLFYNNLIIDSQIFDSTFIWIPQLTHEQGLKEYFSPQELDIKP